MARVRAVAPRLRPWEAYLLARFYVAREAMDEHAADLDGYVAFAPWLSPKHRARWERAIAERWVPDVPPALRFPILTIGGWSPDDLLTAQDLVEIRDHMRDLFDEGTGPLCQY